MKDEKRLQEWENKQGPKTKPKVETPKKNEKGKAGAKDKKDAEKEEPRENTLTETITLTFDHILIRQRPVGMLGDVQVDREDKVEYSAAQPAE
jgi:hypothetical protein